MKYKFLFLSVFIIFLSLSEKAAATVGGPTIKYDFKYNPADQSVYYTEISYGGRGCPPILNKMSFINETVTTVFSCEDGEALLSTDRENLNVVYEKFNEITEGFQYLMPISLKKNDFVIDVNFEKEESLENEPGYIIRRIFSLDIYQKGNLIDNHELVACDIEEPFLFEAYRIDGVENKIILLNSSKENCWEGGYVSDSIRIVENAEVFNREISLNQYKSTTTIIPSQHTLIVYEEEDVFPTLDILDPKMKNDDENKNADSKVSPFTPDNLLIIGLVALVAFVFGLIFGKLISKQV